MHSNHKYHEMWWRKTIDMSVFLVNRSHLSEIQPLVLIAEFLHQYFWHCQKPMNHFQLLLQSPQSFLSSLVQCLDSLRAGKHQHYHPLLSWVLASMSTIWMNSSDCLLCGRETWNILTPTSTLRSGGSWHCYHLGWKFHSVYSFLL